MEFELKKRYSNDDLRQFSEIIMDISNKIGFKVSARGWAYILEGQRLINKNQFDKVATLINTCRKKGYLPIDFVAEETSRAFSGIEEPEDISVVEYSRYYLSAALKAGEYYTPDWWDGEKFYIQMVVEKIDLVTLFSPVCRSYHIPIANAKGWSSILQRAEYCRRYKDAESRGLKCVLLYCGDHDPDGLRIGDFITKNLSDVRFINWSDGTSGYDPRNLIVHRFGLNYDFIQKHNLTWIDNLITGGEKDLADKKHPNNKLPYVQNYIREIGIRKCEANAIVTMPDAAQDLVKKTIESYLGPDALQRFEKKREAVRAEYAEFLQRTGASDAINSAIDSIDSE